MSYDFKQLPENHLSAIRTIAAYVEQHPDIIEVCKFRDGYITVNAYQMLVERDALANATNLAATVVGAELVAFISILTAALVEAQPQREAEVIMLAQAAAHIIAKDKDAAGKMAAWAAHNINVPSDFNEYALKITFAQNIMEEVQRRGLTDAKRRLH